MKDLDKIEIYEHALNKIASWPEGPEVDGSFDEPNSAELAREALALCKRYGHGYKPLSEGDKDALELLGGESERQ